MSPVLRRSLCAHFPRGLKEESAPLAAEECLLSIFPITETRPETHCRCRRPECQPSARPVSLRFRRPGRLHRVRGLRSDASPRQRHAVAIFSFRAPPTHGRQRYLRGYFLSPRDRRASARRERQCLLECQFGFAQYGAVTGVAEVHGIAVIPSTTLE